MSVHVWRQCNTLAVAQNFYEEKNPIWLPTIDRRNETNGITGMPFPIYEYILSKFILISGNNFTTYRIFALIISILTLFFFFLFVKNLHNSEWLALITTFILMSVPEYFYHSINALPDNLALLFGFISLYYSLKIDKKQGFINIIFWFVATTLCGLIKFQFLILPLSSIYINFSFSKLKFYAIPFLLSFSINVSWYFYALKLTKLNNLKEFGLWILPTSFSEKINIITSNLISDLPDLLIGYPIFIVFISLIIYQIYHKNISMPNFIKIGFLCFLIFYIVAIERMRHHGYYFLVLIPFIILFFIENLKKVKINKTYILIFLLISMIWASVRIYPKRWTNTKAELPKELMTTDSLNKLKALINRENTVAIGSDLSGCVYFFFTQSKGFSFATSKELFEQENGEKKIDKFIRLGIKQLIIEKKDNFEIIHKSLKTKGNVGNFWVYDVVEKELK